MQFAVYNTFRFSYSLLSSALW